MRKLKLIGLGLTGITGFMFFMVNATSMFQAFKKGASDDIGGQTILFALAGFIVAGICGGLFEHVRLGATGNNNIPEKQDKMPANENDEKIGGPIDEGKFLGGLFLIGVAIFEFSTNYFRAHLKIDYYS